VIATITRPRQAAAREWNKRGRLVASPLSERAPEGGDRYRSLSLDCWRSIRSFPHQSGSPSPEVAATARRKAQLPGLPFASMASSAPRPSLDRVTERRHAVALARHYREAEGLSIAQIADRLGRSPTTVKAYFYDPTGAKARAVKARYVGVCRGCGAYTQPRNGKGDAYAYCNCAARRSVVSPAQPGETRRDVLVSWVQWLTRIRKVNGTIACQEGDGHAQVPGVRRRGTRPARAPRRRRTSAACHPGAIERSWSRAR